MIKYKFVVNGNNIAIVLSKTFKNVTMYNNDGTGMSGTSGAQVVGNLSIDRYAEYLDFKKKTSERNNVIGWMFGENTLSDGQILAGMTNPLTSLINSLKTNIERLEKEYERKNNTGN